jgi:hypothetical protein
MKKDFVTVMLRVCKKILPKFLITFIFTKTIIYIYKKLYYFGNVVYCPCCGKQFRLFQDYRYNKNTQNESHFINNYKNTVCLFCK